MQTAGVQIVVNAQVAAALKALGVLGAEGPAAFNRIENAAKSADVAATGFATKIVENNRKLKSAIGGIALNASLFAGPKAQQFIYPLILMQKELKGLTSAAALAGVTLPMVGLGITAITGAVAIGATGWSAYKAQVEASRTALEAIQVQAKLTETLLKALSGNRTRLPAGEADRLAEALKGTAPDNQIENAKRSLEELAQTRQNLFQARRLSGIPDFEIEKEFNQQYAKRTAELNAIVAKSPASPVQREATSALTGVMTDADSIKNLERIRELITENNIARMEGFSKERAEAQFTFDKEMKSLEALRLQNPTDEEAAQRKQAEDSLRATRDQKFADIEKRRTAENLKQQREITEEIRRREKAAEEFYAHQDAAAAQLEERIRKANAESTLGPRGVLDIEERADLKLVDAQVSDHKRAEELKTLITQDYAARRREIEKNEQEKLKAIRDTQLTGTQTMFANMAAAAKMYGRQGLVAYKAFAIAEATINTFKAAEAAYASVVGIPFIGPALAPMAAGAAIAAGAAQVAAINATGFLEGGYTGTGDNSQVAGVVHKNEWVIPADSVQAWGHQNMAAIQKGPSAMTATSGGGSRIDQTLVAFFDKDEMHDYMRDHIEAQIVQVGKRHFVRL